MIFFWEDFLLRRFSFKKILLRFSCKILRRISSEDKFRHVPKSKNLGGVLLLPAAPSDLPKSGGGGGRPPASSFGTCLKFVPLEKIFFMEIDFLSRRFSYQKFLHWEDFLSRKKLNNWEDFKYSCVHISSDVVFSKIMKKQFIVLKQMIPHMKAKLIFIEKKNRGASPTYLYR